MPDDSANSSSVGGSSHIHAVHGSDHTHHSHTHDHHPLEHDPDRFFVVPRGVILEYGPYTFHGVCDFRVERLQGLQKSLQKLGARVTLIPCTDYVNRVRLWYMDNVIFSAKITDFQHGGDGEMDILAISAAKAFDHASRKAIHGLQFRIRLENKDLLDPFCPCLNPNFFGSQAKETKPKKTPKYASKTPSQATAQVENPPEKKKEKRKSKESSHPHTPV